MYTETSLSVGAVARLAGVTVRTLHHYDELGLVSPSQRSDAGYRQYMPHDVERLQEVLFFRELGLGLDEIHRMVHEAGYSRSEALASQRQQLVGRSERIRSMIEAIDRAIDAQHKGINMTNEEMLEVFGDFDPKDHADEVEERWGGTPAFEESQRRVSGYTKHDWLTIKAEAKELDQALLGLMTSGVDAGSPEAMALAERHRDHITKWFYECTPEIHAGLGQMYVSDPRFKQNIDKAGAGLAQYLSDAIAANHQRPVN